MTCQICGEKVSLISEKELNISCGDYFSGRRLYNDNAGTTPLLECSACGFAYFSEMHTWTAKKLATDIYNESYILADAPFKVDRPTKIANWLKTALRPCTLTDFGGGDGLLSNLLNESGFSATTYDPFHGDTKNLDATPVRVVTAFEVVEHVANQSELFRTLKQLCQDDGLIIFSTLLKDRALKKDWYYASPRNGHISFHSEVSLKLLMNQVGLNCISLNKNMHICGNFDLLIGEAIEAIDTPPYRLVSGNNIFARI